MKYYRYKSENVITCLLCQHHCDLESGSNGICSINYNIDSKLVNSTYSHPSVVNIDPVEKKPLYHFMPTTKTLSLGTVGCNFRCPFCQNYSISQSSQVSEKYTLTPQDVVNLRKNNIFSSISYTYNEPTIWYPYAKDIGVLAKEQGLKNIFVSSGYESENVLEDLPSWLDAANIDLKSFNPEYYKRILKTKLEGVLHTLKVLAKGRIHLEITTLIIPGVNDSDQELHAMANFIAEELGLDTIWHFSASHPDYKMQTTPRTPITTLQSAKKIAQSYGIKYVYIGNTSTDNSTYCQTCDTRLIQRQGFNVSEVLIKNGQCPKCAESIIGVWE